MQFLYFGRETYRNIEQDVQKRAQQRLTPHSFPGGRSYLTPPSNVILMKNIIIMVLDHAEISIYKVLRIAVIVVQIVMLFI